MDRPIGTPDEERTVRIPAGRVMLEGTLGMPESPQGVVLFAHGSGSSRHSPRNRFVAEALRGGGLATLLFDLLSAEEEAVDMRTRELRFDITRLAERLLAATAWLTQQRETSGLRFGYFGASTGAVVSRGGRPDLAGVALPLVSAPTLLIVGSRDEPVLALNEEAMARMRAEVKMEVIPGATHLFEEPGALEDVARLAREWFLRHLPVAMPDSAPA